MKHHSVFVVVMLAAIGLTGLGCARAARDTAGFALREQTIVSASFEQTWHATKQVLLEQGYDIYTRDKRGAFVAFTPMRRTLWLQPRRTKFSIEMARLAPEETAVAIESVRQVYGVTLLTHPDWHDRKETDPEAAQAILDSIRLKLADGAIEAEAFVDVDAAQPEETADYQETVPPTPYIEETPLPLPAEQDPVIEDADTVL